MEERTTTLTFVPSPEFRKILDELSVPKAEYVVEDPIFIEATTESGETMRYPTAVRERVVRCRDCAHSEPCPLVGTEKLVCNFLDEMLVNPDGFCAWGERRGWR